MCRFLHGGPFKGVVDVYGRPRVRTWNVLEYGSADASVTPRFARREVDTVDAEDSLWAVARRESERHRKILDQPGLSAHATAIDPDRWEIARFSLWSDERFAGQSGADCVHSYTVA